MSELVYPTDPNDIRQLACKAREQASDYIEEKCAEAQAQRDFPVIAFCGPGRCGKDTAIEWLASNYLIRGVGSVALAVAPIIGNVLQVSAADVMAERHEHRDFWFQCCNGLREKDPTLLVKLTLADNDVVAGIRAAIELEACVAAKLIKLTVWIARDTPNDPTIEYGRNDCDIVLENTSGMVRFCSRLRRLADALYPPELRREEVLSGRAYF